MYNIRLPKLNRRPLIQQIGDINSDTHFSNPKLNSLPAPLLERGTKCHVVLDPPLVKKEKRIDKQTQTSLSDHIR